MSLLAVSGTGSAIINIIVILILIGGTVYGFSKGFNENSVRFIGLLLILVGGYYIKNPIFMFLYSTFPKLNFSGITMINIVFYEIIAYIIAMILLFVVLRIIAIYTKIIDIIASLILNIGVPSKILGIVIGFASAYLFSFIFLYAGTVASTRIDVDFGNTYVSKILRTPVLNDTVGKSFQAVTDIMELKDEYDEKNNSDEYNLKVLDISLKYDIITSKEAKELIEKGKIDIPGSGDIVSRYSE